VGKRCSDNILRHVDAAGRELCVDGCPLAATMKDCAPREAEVFLHHREGHRIPVVVRAIGLLDDEGRASGAVEVFADRSERSTLLAELERLKREVLADPLTGLGNRRFLEMCVGTRFHELADHQIPFGLLILDIDHFKRVNDAFGHAAGDATLRMVAGSVAGAVRRLDVAARFGGEEFVVISPNVDLASLAEMAERVRLLVERSWLDLPDRRRVAVTVSVGGALARAGEGFDSLLARADERLYACKEGGRNRSSVGD